MVTTGQLSPWKIFPAFSNGSLTFYVNASKPQLLPCQLFSNFTSSLSVVTLMVLRQPDVLLSRHWLCAYLRLWCLRVLKMGDVINSNEYLTDTIFANRNSEAFVPWDALMVLKIFENSKEHF